MAVPEDVRKVERPVGTVVCDGKDGRYPVREKLSGTYYVDEDGKRHRPSRNGKVVGHIIDMRYVPKDPIESVSVGSTDLKDWANVEMFDRLGIDLLKQLRLLYSEEDAKRLYVISLLRAAYKGLPDRKLEREYERSFLSEMYPGVNLGRTSVSTFHWNVGRTCSRITKFMRMAVNRIPEGEHVIIDGSLRQDHSTENSLSAVSRKTSKRGHKEILLMYAYSMEHREPICSKVYPGNMVDQRAVTDFLKEFSIGKGIIVADKGFTVESIRKAVDGNDGLHYLLPLKRDAAIITELDLRTYDSRLDGDGGIRCRKVSHQSDGRSVWYYSFWDPLIFADEEAVYMSKHKGDDYNAEDHSVRIEQFGTIVFESDMEMECGEAYSIYDNRWLIELFFRVQEDQMELDDTRVHSNYSVISSNFMDYLASIMVSRMLNRLDELHLLDDNTYGDIIEILERAQMTRSTGNGWEVCRISGKDAEILEKMGLLSRPIVPKEVKKKGRPVGSKDSYPRRRKSKKNDLPVTS